VWVHQTLALKFLGVSRCQQPFALLQQVSAADCARGARYEQLSLEQILKVPMELRWFCVSTKAQGLNREKMTHVAGESLTSSSSSVSSPDSIAKASNAVLDANDECVEGVILLLIMSGVRW
jgi:hypothetical protein